MHPYYEDISHVKHTRYSCHSVLAVRDRRVAEIAA